MRQFIPDFVSWVVVGVPQKAPASKAQLAEYGIHSVG